MQTTAYFANNASEAIAYPPIFQWSYGQVLRIAGLELPDNYLVHFCNIGDSETKTVQGDTNGAEIPNACLKTGRDVTAYLYYENGSGCGATQYIVTIPVRRREKPNEQSVNL